MPAVSTGHITLTSNPHKKRVGLIPICVIIIVSFGCVLSNIVVAAAAVRQQTELSLMIILMMTAFGGVLGIISFGLLRDAYRDYILELTDTEAVLVVIDRLRKKKGTQMVLLDDVSYAEYFPCPDSASIILHTAYTNMDVPLWPMTNQGRDVVDYLEGRGVRVINVLSDDPIPD